MSKSCNLWSRIKCTNFLSRTLYSQATGEHTTHKLMSQPERILHIILICMRCLSVCNCSWSSIFRMKKSSSTETRIKIRSFPRLLPQFFSYFAWFFFKSFSKDTEQPHCAESWPSCQAFCWSSLDYHLFTPPQIPCALGSFGLGLNSKWEGTDASLWELSSLVILGVE